MNWYNFKIKILKTEPIFFFILVSDFLKSQIEMMYWSYQRIFSLGYILSTLLIFLWMFWDLTTISMKSEIYHLAIKQDFNLIVRMAVPV